MENSQKPKSIWKPLLIIIGVIVLIFGLYLGLAWVLRVVNEKYLPEETGSTSKTTASLKVDQALAGTWDTGCLVPDANSPWAERHTFIINSEGIANHKRYSGNSCEAMAVDNDDNLNFVIPESGKINLTFTSGIAAGTTTYDIYQISGKTLKFGHGFCNCSSSGGKYGTSEADRFIQLNDFLVYKK